MLGCSRVSRFVLPRKMMVGLLSTFVSIGLLPCGVAVADTVTSDFEAPLFHLGSVNGQDGWKSAPPGAIPSCDPTPTNGQYDQAVVANGAGTPAAFGQQSLRMSNLCGSGEFTFQTYSRHTALPAGEHQANTEYIAQFSFISKTTAYQPGLFLSVSPDSSEGSRMSYVGLRDTPDGIAVTVADTPKVDGDFETHPVALLARGVPHSIKFWIKLNPGPNNDLVRIYIDGKDVGQCFATWENYYRTSPEQAPPPNVNTPASIDALQFRSSVQGPSELATSGGFLFDNVTVTTANRTGPPGCDVPIEKQADTHTVSPGSLAGFRIAVRNRGRLTARNLLVCDHIPRKMTFVSANRKLLHLGSRRCLAIAHLAPGQRVSFNLKLRVNANAPPGTAENIADVTPIQPPGSPLAPSSPLVPPAPRADVPGNNLPGKITEITPIKKAIAIVKIRAKRPPAKRVRPRRPPPVTG